MSVLTFLFTPTVIRLFLANAIGFLLMQTVEFFVQLGNTILVVHLRGLFGTHAVSN